MEKPNLCLIKSLCFMQGDLSLVPIKGGILGYVNQTD